MSSSVVPSMPSSLVHSRRSTSIDTFTVPARYYLVSSSDVIIPLISAADIPGYITISPAPDQVSWVKEIPKPSPDRIEDHQYHTSEIERRSKESEASSHTNSEPASVEVTSNEDKIVNEHHLSYINSNDNKPLALSHHRGKDDRSFWNLNLDNNQSHPQAQHHPTKPSDELSLRKRMQPVMAGDFQPVGGSGGDADTTDHASKDAGRVQRANRLSPNRGSDSQVPADNGGSILEPEDLDSEGMSADETNKGKWKANQIEKEYCEGNVVDNREACTYFQRKVGCRRGTDCLHLHQKESLDVTTLPESWKPRVKIFQKNEDNVEKHNQQLSTSIHAPQHIDCCTPGRILSPTDPTKHIKTHCTFFLRFGECDYWPDCKFSHERPSGYVPRPSGSGSRNLNLWTRIPDLSTISTTDTITTTSLPPNTAANFTTTTGDRDRARFRDVNVGGSKYGKSKWFKFKTGWDGDSDRNEREKRVKEFVDEVSLPLLEVQGKGRRKSVGGTVPRSGSVAVGELISFTD
ncbi:hypothetical protein RUND412_002842 [Rhizina undulata]